MLNGGMISRYRFKGQGVIVVALANMDMWASTCHPCKLGTRSPAKKGPMAILTLLVNWVENEASIPQRAFYWY